VKVVVTPHPPPPHPFPQMKIIPPSPPTPLSSTFFFSKSACEGRTPFFPPPSFTWAFFPPFVIMIKFSPCYRTRHDPCSLSFSPHLTLADLLSRGAGSQRKKNVSFVVSRFFHAKRRGNAYPWRRSAILPLFFSSPLLTVLFTPKQFGCKLQASLTRAANCSLSSTTHPLYFPSAERLKTPPPHTPFIFTPFCVDFPPHAGSDYRLGKVLPRGRSRSPPSFHEKSILFPFFLTPIFFFFPPPPD